MEHQNNIPKFGGVAKAKNLFAIAVNDAILKNAETLFL